MNNNFIHDRGGTRSGNDRRQKESNYFKLERRSFRDRRSGSDRRGDSIQRSGIERRDFYRGKDQHIF